MGCDDELIDGAVYRVSDQLFSASSSTNSNPPHSAREGSGSSWCTENLANGDTPWLEVWFGVDVEIQAISTGGLKPTIFPISHEYISSYQVQYAGVNVQQLQNITDQNSTNPKV